MPAEVSSTGSTQHSTDHTFTTANAHAMNGTSQRALTLIVAATKDLGIGKDGGLPWPQLKQEMGYFARVTKRQSQSQATKTINAVVMGRKTWDSIPAKFRPLKGRLNVVVSRSMKQETTPSGPEGPLIVASLEVAMEELHKREEHVPNEHVGDSHHNVGDIFIIGGSSIYDAALAMPITKRVLYTKIKQPDYDCDTFFPVNLDSHQAKEDGWHRKSWKQLVDFAGGADAVGGSEIVASEGHVKEGNVEWEYCLYEKR